MNKIFIHRPIFRLVSPILTGVMIYLLILLLNNDTTQVVLLFESREVYVCIITSYIIIEANRWIIRTFDRYQAHMKEWQQFLIIAILNLSVSMIVASATLHLYFNTFVGFSPSGSELWIFNIICMIISALHFTLYFSHLLLYKENTTKLANEKLTKKAIMDEFSDFKNDINPELLYASLEQVITLAYENTNKAEELIDYLSSIYRYMLGHKQTELTAVDEELQVTRRLVLLLNELPVYHVDLDVTIESSRDIHVIPGTIIAVIENIVKRSICHTSVPLHIRLYTEDEYLIIQYKPNDHLNIQAHLKPLDKIQRAYSYFTDRPLVEVSAYDDCYTKIPILILKQETVA